MKLESSEKRWLKDYRAELERQFPGQVEGLSIYGSKARGEGNAESDLDVLLIVKDKATRMKSKMRQVGYLLAADGNAVPSILAYTRQEWDRRARRGSPFRTAVDRDAVSVL
jgi:predicted nucleotidyltransferase